VLGIHSKVVRHRLCRNRGSIFSETRLGGKDKFVCRVARNPDEIQALIEAGFEFVLQKDGFAYFRKRK
jgi:hypothetical protein